MYQFYGVKDRYGIVKDVSLDESLVCINKKSSTKKPGQVEFKTWYSKTQVNLLASWGKGTRFKAVCKSEVWWCD